MKEFGKVLASDLGDAHQEIGRTGHHFSSRNPCLRGFDENIYYLKINDFEN